MAVERKSAPEGASGVGGGGFQDSFTIFYHDMDLGNWCSFVVGILKLIVNYDAEVESLTVSFCIRNFCAFLI